MYRDSSYFVLLGQFTAKKVEVEHGPFGLGSPKTLGRVLSFRIPEASMDMHSQVFARGSSTRDCGFGGCLSTS